MSASLAALFECPVNQWTIVQQPEPESNAKGEKRVVPLTRRKTASQMDTTTSNSKCNPSEFSLPTAFMGHWLKQLLDTASSSDRYDYESNHDSDAEGEGMGPNACVWRAYLDEAGRFDASMVENIRDTVAVVLVFVRNLSLEVRTPSLKHQHRFLGWSILRRHCDACIPIMPGT